jgi:hypothetical protein
MCDLDMIGIGSPLLRCPFTHIHHEPFPSMF